MSMLLLNLSLPRWATAGQWGGKLGKKVGDDNDYADDCDKNDR